MDRLQTLVLLYINDQASDAEVSEMLFLLRTEPANDVKALLLRSYSDNGLPVKETADWQAMWAVIEAEMHTEVKQPVKLPTVKRWWAFAAVLILIAGAGYWMVSKPAIDVPIVTAAKQSTPDIAPGATGAVLTMPDGRKIILDTASNGIVATGDQSAVLKGDNGITVEAAQSVTPAYATLTTPLGRTQNMVLSDGTRVWLNAGSSIYFPVAFTAAERRVQITGEVYFEVAENKRSPFRVNVNGALLEVLGTKFNINAYPDEKAVKTTLLSGSLQISKDGSSGILKPEQQALFAKGSAKISITDDPFASNSIAWVNGFFHFEKADIYTVMRQIARWYDVEIVYDGNPTNDRFGGDMQRNLPLSAVLKALQKSQVHFKIEEKKLIVMP
jgi:transmembrane sensor